MALHDVGWAQRKIPSTVYFSPFCTSSFVQLLPDGLSISLCSLVFMLSWVCLLIALCNWLLCQPPEMTQNHPVPHAFVDINCFIVTCFHLVVVLLLTKALGYLNVLLLPCGKQCQLSISLIHQIISIIHPLIFYCTYSELGRKGDFTLAWSAVNHPKIYTV